MTTDPFTEAARAVGADPEEVRESMRNATEYASRNGMSDAEFVLWIWHAGAIYGRDHLAAQEATDAEVEAAARALWAELWIDPDQHPWDTETTEAERESCRRDARAALSAARAARRDEEKR